MSDFACPYCDYKLTPWSHVSHVEQCVHNPEIRATLLGYMRRHTVDGVCISKHEYEICDERRALNFPSPTTIAKQFGSWNNFIVWCGLKPTRVHDAVTKTEQRNDSRTRREERIIASIDADILRNRQMEKDAFDWSAMPAIDRGVRTVYDWRTMTYRQCHVMELR